MASGKVKWFNNAKGYGFILPEEGGEDLFVHYSAILMDGYKTLKAGQAVEYEPQRGPKGYHAINVQAHEPAPRRGGGEASDAREASDAERASDAHESRPESTPIAGEARAYS